MMKLRQNSTLLIIFLISAIIHGRVFAHDENPDEQPEEIMRLKMIHRYSPHYKGHGMPENRPKTQLELIKQLHRHDIARQQMISHRRQQQEQEQHHDDHHDQGLNSTSSTRRKDWETRPTMAMPMNSGWDYGFSQYLVKIRVGTPPQKFMLVADTGSDLTWMNCRYRCGKRCGLHGRTLRHKRIFRADVSSTFKTVPCASPTCKNDFSSLFSLARCPTPFSPCRYDFSYAEGSSALGIFANETVRATLTNGRRTRLQNVVIGCTDHIRGKGGIKGGDGILGLGFSKYSFTGKAAQNFGGKFSYCLVDHQSPKNVTSYLTFGRNKGTVLHGKMTYTNLVQGNTDVGAFYAVKVQGISIGGKMLYIPSQLWTLNQRGDGGTHLDSGTSLTYLALPAYRPVMVAYTMALSKFKRLPEAGDPFEFCFNPTGFNEALVPKFAIHFADGAKFEPPVKSYVIDVEPQVKCLAFVIASPNGPAVTIGNIMQQNFLWEFDLVRETVGFAPSRCI